MIYLSLKMKSDNNLVEQINKKLSDEKEHKLSRTLYSLNKRIMEMQDKSFKLFCTDGRENELNFIAIVKMEDYERIRKNRIMEKCIEIILDVHVKSSFKEITPKEFADGARFASNKEYLAEAWHEIRYDLNIDYFDNSQFKVKQEIISGAKMTLKQARVGAGAILADETLNDELVRMFSSENPKKFYGHPVHYRIKCGNVSVGYKTAELLVKCLRANGRLVGSRIDKVTNVTENCYDETDLDSLFKDAKGNTIVIDTRGEYDVRDGKFASSYESVVQYINEQIKENYKDVLFILIEQDRHPGFSKHLIPKLSEFMEFVDINEGRGDKEASKEYLSNLISESGLDDFKTEIEQNIVFENDSYAASEIHKMYDECNRKVLRNTIYKSYKEMKKAEIKAVKVKAKEEFDALIGLDKIKGLVEQIIAANVIDKKRVQATSEDFTMSRHMLFTGNPGSAKTTVARLLAKIFKDEGVLDTGEFVECGRAELTGRYVGWTDKTVKEQFKKATGGILFIDEAYALVEQDGLYGDEAIHTIVQEMENRRDEVIVIFAGYPDKMKQFLDKNEGLKSRISFHIDFPDYEVDDLMKIFEKMMSDKEYSATDGVKEKVRDIFARVSKTPDFGNGRFVRNVLEQAILKQSVRLYKEYGSDAEIPKDVLLLLTEEDIDENTLKPFEKAKNTIGFCA